MITLIIALLLCEAVILGSLVYTDHGIWGAFSLIVALATYGVVTGWTPLGSLWSTILTSPVATGLTVLSYLGVGTLWSFFKYYSFVREGKRNGRARAYVEASSNTSKVITWMAYWPISIVLHVIGDGVYKLFRWIYDQVSGVYNVILNKVYGE